MNNFHIFGIYPIRFIKTTYESFGGIYTIFWFLLSVSVILLFLNKLQFFTVLKLVIEIGIKIVYNVYSFGKFAVKQSYMMILMDIDAYKNGYNRNDYWKSRTLTKEGIRCNNDKLIPHFAVIQKAILYVDIAKKIFSNIKLRVFSRSK